MPVIEKPVRRAASRRLLEAKQDILYRLDHLHDRDNADPDHCNMRWADDGGRHVD